jgi:hypothetical protein
MIAKPPPVTAAEAELLRQRLRVLVQEAPALIAAGVTSLRVGDIEATLAPPPAKPENLPKARAPARQHIDPLRDPSTYPGGRVPGFTRDEDQEQPGGRRAHE